jgi:5-hydroxyisourate hydrolase-like protein (transthyretin family)
MLTGPDGRFFFRGLRAGAYGVMATKGGYVDGSYGRLRPLGPSLQITLTDGGRFGEATVRMWKHASISGTVLDEAGEPQIAVAVAAYRFGVHAGHPQYLPGGTASTDDRGMFRISGLVPGKWIVGTAINYRSVTLSEIRDMTQQMRQGARGADQAAAIQQFGFLSSSDAGIVLGPGTILPPAESGAAPMVYLPTYHPAATAAEGAASIDLTSGQEYASADLRITPVRAVPVSGVVIGPEGPLPMTPVRLTSGNEEDLIQRNWLTASTDRGGRFGFPAVPTGNYRLRLRTGRGASVAWADLPLAVGIEPIVNLQVDAHEGWSVQGRVEFDGESAARPANNVEVQIERVDQDPGQPAIVSYRTNTAGEFASGRSLPGGRYYVRVANSPRGWMFLGATVEGRDVSDTPLSLTSSVHNIVVSFTDRWSGIQGSVQTSSARDGTALVLVFPTDQDLWGSSGTMARRVRSVRTQRTGEYSLTVPPGDYYVVAVPDESAADWQDPDFMDAASRAAIRVRVGLGERKTQDLRTRSIR